METDGNVSVVRRTEKWTWHIPDLLSRQSDIDIEEIKKQTNTKKVRLMYTPDIWESGDLF